MEAKIDTQSQRKCFPWVTYFFQKSSELGIISSLFTDEEPKTLRDLGTHLVSGWG